jgi:hypothetical protein
MASPAGCLDWLCGDALDAAYVWLCDTRRGAGPNADVWDFRRDWDRQRELIRTERASCRHRFGLLSRHEQDDGGEIELWRARDALVLKALSIVLGQALPSSPRCTHLKNHGGQGRDPAGPAPPGVQPLCAAH